MSGVRFATTLNVGNYSTCLHEDIQKKGSLVPLEE